MSSIDRLIGTLRLNPAGIRFVELARICEHFFGPPRQSGGSHMIFKTPWPGDPRVNIQKGPGGKAKAYQVRQVLAAIDRLAAMSKGEGP
jgi:hypothetical protein